MRKIIAIFITALICACSAPPKESKAEVELTLPPVMKTGYFQLNKEMEYYVDTKSIWNDNADKRLVHFDVVINSAKGLFVDPNNDKFYAKSTRENKILNCESRRLTHVRRDFYSEFWGEGVSIAPKFQNKQTLALNTESSLHVLGKVLCGKMYRNW